MALMLLACVMPGTGFALDMAAVLDAACTGEGDVNAVLAAAGEPDETVAELSKLLAEAPTPGAVVGPLLDQLAFDTDIDLEAARRELVAVWTWNSKPQSERAAPLWLTRIFHKKEGETF